jgi:hypothetical protein
MFRTAIETSLSLYPTPLPPGGDLAAKRPVLLGLAGEGPRKVPDRNELRLKSSLYWSYCGQERENPGRVPEVFDLFHY